MPQLGLCSQPPELGVRAPNPSSSSLGNPFLVPHGRQALSSTWTDHRDQQEKWKALRNAFSPILRLLTKRKINSEGITKQSWLKGACSSPAEDCTFPGSPFPECRKLTAENPSFSDNNNPASGCPADLCHPGVPAGCVLGLLLSVPGLPHQHTAVPYLLQQAEGSHSGDF